MLDRADGLLRPGGVLVTDNVLWSGAVVPGMTPLQERTAADTEAIAAYNRRLRDDPRFFTTWLPIGDGVSISTKVQPT